MSAHKISKFLPHHEEELTELLGLSKGVRSILEIGSRYGDTLMEMAKVSDKAKIVAIDLPNVFPWGEDSQARLETNIKELQFKGHEVHLFLGNSRDEQIVKQVRKLGPYDIVFIDGDHTYEGAKNDWINYGCCGRTIVFHDIVKPKEGERQELEVWKLWKEIKQTSKLCPVKEFIGKDSRMGLGIING